ncbi:translation initiation factor IF-2 N-terminal domain-containing protein, partial [Spirulina sp. 06S082]|uniref:translation initiation factor IF-2 N-terminal domain-containing protein n=1 Tax=Spirulina sp. 06S082 TaxID=3110248 RepID=UPI002B21CB3F
MNNGKTRIYDLSKELNLENKDILDICGRLDIAVKSHSSTITDTQVEQIRASAKTYRPSPPKNSHSKSREEREAAEKSLRPKGPRKPQIRGILKNEPHSERGENSPISRPNSPNNPKLVTPPNRPLKTKPSPPRAASETSNVPQVRPSQRDQDRDKISEERAVEQSVSSLNGAPQRPSMPNSAQQQTSRPEQQAKPEETNELLVPPSRPQPPSIKKTDERPTPRKGKKSDSSRSDRHLEEVPRPISSKPERKHSGSRTEVKTDGAMVGASGKGRDGSKERNKDQGAKKAKPSAKLQQKPQKPIPQQLRKPKAFEETSSDDLDDGVIVEDQDVFDGDPLLAPPERPQPKLKRPNVSRKPKVWEEEEEDPDGKAKAGKAKAGKTGKKRKALIIDDEDDEFDVDRNSLVAPAAVSLSIARPPKPAGSNRVKAAPTAKATKKPPVKADRDRAKEESRNKTERKVAAKPPE